VSSSIVSLGYAASLRILEVEFANGGIYQYAGVPDEAHRALLAAESKGLHVHRFIKGRFPFQRVGEALR
jgi:hypothetical protein